MFFRRNIDAAFVNNEYKVALSIRNLQPWSIANCKNTLFVIERFAQPDLEWFKSGDPVLEVKEDNDESLPSM